MTVLQEAFQYIFKKYCLFSEIELDTDMQVVVVTVSAKKTLTVCYVYLPPSQDVNLSNMEHLVLQLPTPFVLI